MTLTFHLIPHTHWDREWYLSRGQFGARLVRMIDELIELLRKEPRIPGFLLDGQTILLEDYLQVRPDQEPVVRELVKNGSIETGPWYVLADEQIPSGEALIRNLLLGQTDTARLGRRLDVLYSPDAFGHPAILPTLAAEFRLGSAVAWRGIRGNGGSDLFEWHAPDGARLPTYLLPPQGYEIGSTLPSTPDSLAKIWRPLREALVARAKSSHIAVFVGADHHFPRRDLVQLRDRLAGLEPEHEFELSRLQDFMDQVRSTSGIPVLSGEQRWSYGYTWTLQDVHSTRIPIKLRNSRLELWLERYAEPLSALAALQGRRDHHALLAQAWRTLVQCHFHDAIGGCCADAVALEVKTRLTAVEGMARELVRAGFNQLVGHDPDAARDRSGASSPALVLWNPAPRTRAGLVMAATTWFRRDILVGPPGNRKPREASGYQPFVLTLPGGELLPVQVLEIVAGQERLDADRHYPDQDEVDLVRIAFQAPELAGLGTAVLTPVAGSGRAQGPAVHVRQGRLVTERLTAEPSRDGSFQIRDHRSGHQWSGLGVLEHQTDAGDSYTFAPAGPARGFHPGRTRIVARGPLLGGFTTRWSWPDIEARLLVLVSATDPVVRCTLELNNRGSNQRIRLRLPTGLKGVPALAGAQLGLTERNAVGTLAGDFKMETPARTAPAHRFVMVQGRGRGLALLGPGFFEYELTPEGDLLLTALRSVGTLSRDNLATRPGHAGWPMATPLAQCHGIHRMDFAIVPLAGEDDAVSVSRWWEDCFVPIRATWYREWLPHQVGETPGIELEGEGLVLSAIKPADTGPGVIVRCYNLKNETVGGTLVVKGSVKRAVRCRADESPIQPVILDEIGRVRFSVAPYALVTLLLE